MFHVVVLNDFFFIKYNYHVVIIALRENKSKLFGNEKKKENSNVKSEFKNDFNVIIFTRLSKSYEILEYRQLFLFFYEFRVGGHNPVGSSSKKKKTSTVSVTVTYERKRERERLR